MIKKFSNMTIAARLTISFVPIILVFVAAIIHANFTISNINNLHRHNIYYVVARSDYALYIQQEFMSFRRLSRATVMNAEWRAYADYDARREYERELSQHHSLIMGIAESYIELVYDDYRINAGYGDYLHMSLISEAVIRINKVYYYLSGRFFLDGDSSYDEGYMVSCSDEAYELLFEMRKLALREREEMLAEINGAVTQSGHIFNLITLAFLLFAIGTAVMLIRSYKRNIIDLGRQMALVEDGDFKTSREFLGANEISRMFVKLTTVFSNLMNEINEVSLKLKDNNDNVRINAESFKGSYKETAEAINALINTLVESKEKELAASAELIDVNARAKIIFDEAPFAISFWTYRGEKLEITDLNNGFMEMFGVMDKERLLREFAGNKYTPEFQPCGTPSQEYIISHTAIAVETGSQKFNLMHFDVHGEPVPCEIMSVSVKFREDDGIIAYARDLRESILSQEKIREANERVMLMLDSTPLACFLVDKNFEAIDCNMEAVSLFGLPEKSSCIRAFDMISRCSDCVQSERLCDEEGRDCALKMRFYDALEYGHAKVTWALQIPYSDKDIPCEISYVRLVYRDDFVIAAYITDLRIRNKLIEDSRRLEIAEENSLAKSQFLTNMSHEIRTPMNAILGITEIQLQKTNFDSDIREAFEKIYLSGEMLLGIINDILDLSKIEAGKMEIAKEKYEIVSMIHDTVVLNMMHMESKPIKFDIDIEETIPAYMLGDELRIKQVINNVLSNAFKYTDEGFVKMTVRSESKDSDMGLVDLIVIISDTGQGMTKDQIDKLFESYARFNVKANRFIEGSGLGMSITKSIMDIMRGDIIVESEPDKGSTFTIRIPQIKVGDQQVGKGVVSNLNKFRYGRVHMKYARIAQEPMPYGQVLIVDDVEMNIYVARGLLAPYALQIDAVDSGFAAIQRIKDGNEYDIIFMDHMMPQMDGIEATKRIRDMGYSLPIVALTANAIAGQLDVFLKSGFDDFISKPIDIRQLNSVLNKFIRDKRAHEVMDMDDANVAKSEAIGVENESGNEFDEYMKSSGLYDLACRDFLSVQKDFVSELTLAIEGNDLKRAHFLAHTLKGMAGLIGENVLVKLSEETESYLRKDILPTGLDALFLEVERVLFDIEERYPQRSDSQPDDRVLDKEKAKEVFDKLAPLLKISSFDALSLVDELSQIPKTNKLIEQIESIDFDIALNTLEELRKTLEV